MYHRGPERSSRSAPVQPRLKLGVSRIELGGLFQPLFSLGRFQIVQRHGQCVTSEWVVGHQTQSLLGGAHRAFEFGPRQVGNGSPREGFCTVIIGVGRGQSQELERALGLAVLKKKPSQTDDQTWIVGKDH